MKVERKESRNSESQALLNVDAVVSFTKLLKFIDYQNNKVISVLNFDGNQQWLLW